jgi:hypothetical protein
MDIRCKKHQIIPFWDCKDPECDPYKETFEVTIDEEKSNISDNKLVGTIRINLPPVIAVDMILEPCQMCGGKGEVPGPMEAPHLVQPCSLCKR